MRLVTVLVLACLAVLPAVAAAQAPPPELNLVVDNQRLHPEELRVKAGTPFVLVIANKGSASLALESKDLQLQQEVASGKTTRVRMSAAKRGTYKLSGSVGDKTLQARLVVE